MYINKTELQELKRIINVAWGNFNCFNEDDSNQKIGGCLHGLEMFIAEKEGLI